MFSLDANATTPLSPSAEQAMKEAMACWGNPSSTHSIGRKGLELLEKNRLEVASQLEAAPPEIVFTSGGSEANTSVILGAYFAQPKDFRLLVSPVEHASVRDSANLVRSLGGSVELVELDSSGSISLEDTQKRLASFRPHLVSVMAANNETGILHPIEEISKLCRLSGSAFHSDAVQAFCKGSDSGWMTADFVSVSAHKVGGPKGVGALRIREGSKLAATHYGGVQELKRRGGTPNTIGIAGFAGALRDRIASDRLGELESLRNHLENRLSARLSGLTIQGKGCPRVPHTSNIRFEGVLGERLMNALDLDGIFISTGSACSSGSVKPSPVLLAMGLSAEAARECVRISLPRDTTSEIMDLAFERIAFHVERMRSRKERF